VSKGFEGFERFEGFGKFERFGRFVKFMKFERFGRFVKFNTFKRFNKFNEFKRLEVYSNYLLSLLIKNFVSLSICVSRKCSKGSMGSKGLNFSFSSSFHIPFISIVIL
jgi:hypothetical protein